MRLLPLAIAGLLMLTADANAARKNVVLLIADDLGLDLGCYGHPVLKTPHLDAMAKAGTRFTHGFASVSSCSPSRATLLTGLPTHACGQYGLAHAAHNTYSFRQVQSLPRLLKAAGYRTGVVGKNHVQPAEVYPYDAEPKVNGRNVAQMADEVRKFITDCGDTPFFLVVGFVDPHRAAKGFGNDMKYPGVPAVKYDPKDVVVPYHLPDQPEVRAELAEYYESSSRMDHGVGLVRQALKDLKVDGETLVMFVSDNGIPFPGAKTTLYDAGVHLPVIVTSPNQSKRGVSCSAMVSFTDIAPTALDWAGVKQPAAMPGKSLLPILDQENPAGWDVVYASHQYHEATMYYPVRMVRTRTHKYLLNLAHQLPYPFASDLYRSDTWQGVLKRGDGMLGKRTVKQYVQRPREELYDLTADPNELNNIAADPKQEAVLADLRTQLRAWQNRTNDPWRIKYEHE